MTEGKAVPRAAKPTVLPDTPDPDPQTNIHQVITDNIYRNAFQEGWDAAVKEVHEQWSRGELSRWLISQRRPTS